MGNFRTFLFEDVLVRYLKYSGYHVRRGMNFTDIEDKALTTAHESKVSLERLTSRHIRTFMDEMRALKMERPDYLPRASKHVRDAIKIVEALLEKGIAYRFGNNIYFDPLKVPGFGKIYGLDMGKWPSRKVRFHLDNYPTTRWNLGDFVLWHGCRREERVCWDAEVGTGWPAWNVQDPSMIVSFVHEPLSIFCGGIDNLVGHHDYNAAILESIRPYPAAKFWLHCHHLMIKGQTMSKSAGNVLYIGSLRDQGYAMEAIRFFLIYGHYRSQINYSKRRMRHMAERLGTLRGRIAQIRKAARGKPDAGNRTALRIRKIFRDHMNADLNVTEAFDGVERMLLETVPETLQPSAASAILDAVRSVDSVLQILL
jgi:cysteinyl-tRNA synthetase